MEVCQENNHNEACNKIRKVYGAKLSRSERKTLVKSKEEGDVSLSDSCETKIQEDLLKVKSQCKGRGSTAEDAVNGVLTHPVMEAFIRQKWHMARFLYFGHIRC